MKRIIFENPDRSIGILIPTEEVISQYSIEQIAEKDVPYKLPFWIVAEDILPKDRTFRDAWVLDKSKLGKPAGHGNKSNVFEDVK